MLKTDYKDDMFTGARKYALVTNEDRTTSLVDMTEYTQEGDQFGANDINDTNAAINALMSTRQVTLPASGWSAEAPYTQTVPVEGMTDADTPVPYFVDNNETETASKAAKKAYGCISFFESAADAITAICKYKKPGVDITVGIKGV